MSDGRFQEGVTPWNKGMIGYRKGIPRPKEVREKISKSLKGKSKYTPYKRNPNVALSCKTCGNDFEVVFSRRSKAKYCSKKCQSKSQIGSIPHNKGKATSIGYSACHDRVSRLRGKPSICEVCGTTSAKKFEWANLTGKYEDVNDYRRMCTSCHSKFDNKITNITGIKF